MGFCAAIPLQKVATQVLSFSALMHGEELWLTKTYRTCIALALHQKVDFISPFYRDIYFQLQS